MVKDSSKHVILGSQQFKPYEFANQINLSMDNAWGIVRCIIDLVMQQKDGKYLIVKDPNKYVVRLYDIPDTTFETDEDSEADGEGGAGNCFFFCRIIVIMSTRLIFICHDFLQGAKTSNQIIKHRSFDCFMD